MAPCVTCAANRGERPTPGGVVYEDDSWRLEHMFEPVPMVGWLVLKPRRHVGAFAELSDDEAASFGPLVRRITGAMTRVLAPAKIYVCLFAEAENTHLHFHLIPRFRDTPRERYGPGAFDYLREALAAGRNLADLVEVERVVNVIRDDLARA